jgi:two-component system cell cycle sensor histidine kinase/response regulator CckA
VADHRLPLIGTHVPRVPDDAARTADQGAAALWAAVVASSEDAILTKDLDGTITSWNAAAQRLYGWSAEEAIGSNVEMLLVDEAEGRAIRDVLKGGRRTGSFETRRRRHDGSLVDVSVSVSPVHDPEGRVIGGAAIARDITDRKAREAALVRSEMRYRTLTSQLPDAVVYEYDRELRVVSAHGSLLTELGSTGAELVGHELVERGDAANYRAALSGEARRFEWESGGSILDVDVVPLIDDAGEVTGGLALARDVSSRRRAERSLHFQAQLLDRIDVAVVAADLDGLVTHWNRQAESYFEHPRADALGRPIAEVTSAIGLSEPAEGLDAPADPETWQREFSIARRDGTELVVLTTRNTVRDAEGVVIGFVDVSLDLTLTRREQEEKVALERRLHQSQKLDGIGRLAGGIAHDFNNLLTIVINYADLLHDELPADDALATYVAEIREASERAARLTRQLLVFGRREVVTAQSMDVNVAIADVITLLRSTIGEDIEVRVDAAPDLWLVGMDRSQLEQVLLNLALNARDAMPAGGCLSMTTRNEPGAGKQPEGGHVMITVADTGCGMPADVVEHAFEPFFTTKGQAGGSGLGLATVYGIVNGVGGHAVIDSAAGSGTTIRITLPAAAAASARPSEPELPVSSLGLGQHILVVEDESGVRELAVLLLTEAGYEVTPAASAEEALRIARLRMPDLLLSDVVMADSSGGELAVRLHAEAPGLPILFTSGYTDDVVTRHLVQERRFAFLQKPFTRRTLLEAVSAALPLGVTRPHERPDGSTAN